MTFQVVPVRFVDSSTVGARYLNKVDAGTPWKTVVEAHVVQ